jgi:hypothetical protein
VKTRKGFGGTLTSCIAKYLESAKISDPVDIVVITDGQVDHGDIKKCDEILEKIGIQFTSMTAFIVYSSQSVNVSVLAPFIRGNWHSRIYHVRNNEQMNCVFDVDQEKRFAVFEKLEHAATVEEIEQVFEHLLEIVTAMTMGKVRGDSTLRDKILRMTDRIKKNASHKLSKNEEILRVFKNLEDQKISTTDELKSVSEFYFANFCGGNFQEKINQLLLMCDGQLSNIFDPLEIRRQMLDRVSHKTEQTEEEEMKSIPIEEISPVHCPITLEDDVKNVCVLIVEDEDNPKGVFGSIDKKGQDSIIRNTFLGKFQSELVKKCIGNYVSLEAFLEMDKYEDPFTRRKIIGYLVLGADHTSVKVSNHGIAKLLTGSNSLIGNPDIWFYNIYSMVKNEQIKWLSPVKHMFEKQMIYRLKNSKATISLSGLANYVQLKSNLANAIYFTLCQPLFVQNLENNSFPNFTSTVDEMLELLDLINYKLPDKRLELYFQAMRLLTKLNFECKKIGYDQFRIKFDCIKFNHQHVPLESLTPAYREFLEKNKQLHSYILLDGMQKKKPEFIYEFGENFDLLYKLSRKITSENLSTFSIPLSMDDVEELFSPLDHSNVMENWPLLKDGSEIIYPSICPKTMRPWSFVNDNQKYWKDAYIEHYNQAKLFKDEEIFDNSEERRPSKHVLSINKYYSDFVESFGFYPNSFDLMTYAFNRLMNGQYEIRSLASLDFEKVIAQYSAVIVAMNTSPEDFVKRIKNSRDRKERIKIESQ